MYGLWVKQAYFGHKLHQKPRMDLMKILSKMLSSKILLRIVLFLRNDLVEISEIAYTMMLVTLDINYSVLLVKHMLICSWMRCKLKFLLITLLQIFLSMLYSVLLLQEAKATLNGLENTRIELILLLQIYLVNTEIYSLYFTLNQ